MAPPEVRLGWSLLTNYLSKGKWKFNFEDDYYADTPSTGTCVIFAFSKLSIWQVSLQSIVAFVAKLVLLEVSGGHFLRGAQFIRDCITRSADYTILHNWQ